MFRIKNLFYAIPILLLVSGCAAGSATALKDLNEEQKSLEIKVDKLKQDLQAAQAERA